MKDLTETEIIWIQREKKSKYNNIDTYTRLLYSYLWCTTCIINARQYEANFLYKNIILKVTTIFDKNRAFLRKNKMK